MLEQSLQVLSKERLIKKGPLVTEILKPQLATLTDKIPSGKRWIFEEKFDGYRILAAKSGKKISLVSRSGIDWASRFPNIVRLLKKIEAKNFILDGEIVVGDDKNRSSFSALQSSLKQKSTDGFRYFVFDLIYLENFDLRRLPLLARKKLLENFWQLDKKSAVELTPFMTEDGKKFYQMMCREKSEGVIAKDITSAYLPVRSRSWYKIKCEQRDEFVIGGFTNPEGSRKNFGSLLVGFYDEKKKLVYSGKVGSGFDSLDLKTVYAQLKNLETSKNPFKTRDVELQDSDVHFVKPKLVAQLKYSQWTHNLRLRHPVFLGLREDKAAKDVGNPFKGV